MRYRIPSHVHHRAVHDEVVILDARTDAYLGLNDSAAVIWSALARDGSTAAALRAVTARFDVSEAEARQDVAALVADLEARALIEPIA